MLHRGLKCIVAMMATALFAGAVTAQEYPAKIVRLVIPYPPGGSAEAQARIVAQALQAEWKQNVVIENKPGAGTTLGAAFVAKAPPDGYTVYLASTSHTVTQSLYKDLPYHAVKSFAPISMIAVSPFVLTVHPGVPARTVSELVALAKSKPGALTYASSGNGAGPHLSGEIFRAAMGIDVVHVPFKGTGPALTALLGDQVHYFFADVAVLPMLKAGKLRALAVTGSQRFSLLPDAPTMIEAGVPGYTTTNWSALVAPAGTPPDIVARINAAVRSALRTPEVVQRYNAQGYEPTASSPQELEAHMTAEVEKYAKAVASAGVKVD
ncbi:MAG: tripartite tricarboxylate transporter substrate binding protein [Burkholderiales bacterium]